MFLAIATALLIVASTGEVALCDSKNTEFHQCVSEKPVVYQYDKNSKR